MQPIRQPSFTDILEDVALEPVEDELAEAAPTPTNQDWLYHIFAAAAEAAVAADASMAAYRELAGETPRLVPLPADEDGVAAELELSTASSLDDLARIRRAFARQNHPDMLHPGLSEHATARMKVANMLIDRRAGELKARC
jgi:hypothetical protein